MKLHGYPLLIDIGKLLFTHAKEAAAKRGYDALELMVWSFNAPARSFYEDWG